MCSDNKWVPGASIIITCHVICKHNNLLLDDVDDLIHKLKTYKNAYVCVWDKNLTNL